MKLLEIRKKLNLTQIEVASPLGITVASYSRYERGEREPDFDTLIKLADFFKVSIDYILGRQESEELFAPAKLPKTEFQALFDCLTPHQQEVIIAKMEGYAEGNAERAAEEQARRKKRA